MDCVGVTSKIESEWGAANIGYAPRNPIPTPVLHSIPIDPSEKSFGHWERTIPFVPPGSFGGGSRGSFGRLVTWYSTHARTGVHARIYLRVRDAVFP